jgi:predicted secreted hydrolase
VRGARSAGSAWKGLAWLALAAALVGGCAGSPILANPPLSFPSPEVTAAPPTQARDPIAIQLPRDDGPHDRLTEWWYYTGHLVADDGRRFGFEAVVFRAERSSVPAAWAAHLALTDEAGQRFTYAQRSEVGPQVDHSPRDASAAPTGFDLQVIGLSPALVAAGAPMAAGAPWRLSGGDGTDHIQAALAPEEATASGRAFGLDLSLHSTKPAVLHNANGFVDFGPAGSSYYYSRTRLDATGTLQLDGETLHVTGIAWFDHQWGDFVSVGAGGWNWFAINLDDGTDIMVSDVLDDRSATASAYATVVDANGSATNINLPDVGLGLNSLEPWTSPMTGRVWPQEWAVLFPGYSLLLESTLRSQELDTRATTGVDYWEGAHDVTGFKDVDPFEDPTNGNPVHGQAYVEMTRYDPIGP